MITDEKKTTRPSDEYVSDQLIPSEDGCCCICMDHQANIQCLPCKHIVCCYQCLVRLACETYVNNDGREECPICKTTIDRFQNTQTRQKLTPGDIQDEYQEDIEFQRIEQKFRREQDNKVAAVGVEQTEVRQHFGHEDAQAQRQMHRLRSSRIALATEENENNNNHSSESDTEIDLESLEDQDDAMSYDSEYGEDNYEMGEITEEDMRMLARMQKIQKRGREEYVPNSSSDDDEDIETVGPKYSRREAEPSSSATQIETRNTRRCASLRAR